jgi:hypothetical protein
MKASPLLSLEELECHKEKARKRSKPTRRSRRRDGRATDSFCALDLALLLPFAKEVVRICRDPAI